MIGFAIMMPLAETKWRYKMNAATRQKHLHFASNIEKWTWTSRQWKGRDLPLELSLGRKFTSQPLNLNVGASFLRSHSHAASQTSFNSILRCRRSMASKNCICKFLATWTAAWHDLWFVAANCLPSRCIAAKHMSHASSPVEKSLRKLKSTKGLGIFQSAPRLCDIFRWGSHGVGHPACILEACRSPFRKSLLGKPQSEGHPSHGGATEIPNQWALVAGTWWASKIPPSKDDEVPYNVPSFNLVGGTTILDSHQELTGQLGFLQDVSSRSRGFNNLIVSISPIWKTPQNRGML